MKDVLDSNVALESSPSTTRGGLAVRTIYAVYENGVFRPTSPVDLPEGTEVRIEPPPLGEPSPVSTDQVSPTGDEVRRRFEALARRWKAETRRMATVREMVRHPAYQEIIGMGDAAVAMLLRELERTPDHWFAALREITASNPVPDEDRGDVRRMAECWIRWGRENGYTW
jgi:predicted DNA-binding antitoxin AbrB/MazE fold protein